MFNALQVQQVRLAAEQNAALELTKSCTQMVAGAANLCSGQQPYIVHADTSTGCKKYYRCLPGHGACMYSCPQGASACIAHLLVRLVCSATVGGAASWAAPVMASRCTAANYLKGPWACGCSACGAWQQVAKDQGWPRAFILAGNESLAHLFE